MIIATIFEMCLHIFHYTLRAFASFDLLYFFEILIVSLMIEFIDYFVMQFFNRVVFRQATASVQTVDAAAEPVVPSLTVQKASENVEWESELVPPQGTMSLVETPHEINDQNVIVPEVRSFTVWKICRALDLPATFVPQQRDTAVSLKQFKKSPPVPIVYSVTIFEMCKAFLQFTLFTLSIIIVLSFVIYGVFLIY
ncbi:hypothetical protein NPIL_34611 [Nephila pilipes]|uniref:Uncharacterized protein n=1 Tax=Nephila pilipes TaxID=299642 RepID=A0A8X6MTH8_NEPPI|nr:hypothetical protein NPIL_34611 [Nephila pilipes]